MKKKLKSRGGVTLLEVLVAVILLTLLTAGGVTATSAVMASYNRMSEAAQAEILASTVIEALSNEIRLGRNIDVTDLVAGSSDGGKSITLDSVTFGEASRFYLEGGRLKADVVTGVDAAGDPVTVTRNVLSESTYDNLTLEFAQETDASGVTTPKPLFKVDNSGARPVYRIEFRVAGIYSDDLWTGSTSVAPLTD